MVGVKAGTFCDFQDVTESEWDNIFTVRIMYTNFTLRVILVHGPQEKEKSEERENFFEELATQVDRGFTSGDRVVVIGDLNARISNEEGKVVGTSSNGKLSANLVSEYKLQICNFSENVEGKWTRIRNNLDGSIEKSTIDYAILDEQLYAVLSEVLIDESKLYCPYGVTKMLEI